MTRLKAQIKANLPDVAVDWVTLIRKHKAAHGEFPRILRPRTFNEKILRRSLLDRRPIFHVIADKLAVRSYVAERLGTEVLPKLYHITDDPRTIPFDDLPQRFVVKPTHASGWLEIVSDRSQCDREALIARCQEWLKRSYYREMREIPYRNIPPRIIVEEFLDGGNGSPAWDFKFFTFHGRAQMIQMVADRFTERTYGFFSPEGKKLNIKYGAAKEFQGEMSRPPYFEEMKAAAEKLAAGLDFVRVDLYAAPKRFYVGELTATPCAGQQPFEPVEYDAYLGQFWRPKRRFFIL